MLQGGKSSFQGFTNWLSDYFMSVFQNGLQDALHECFDDKTDPHFSKLLPGQTRTLEGTRITHCHQVVWWIRVVRKRS